MKYLWTCPFCDRNAVVTDDNEEVKDCWFKIPSRDGLRVVRLQFTVCPNKVCNQFTLIATLHEWRLTEGGGMAGNALERWQLIPPSAAKVFPEYVPKPVLDDYRETCIVKDLSPKASATLARRCLEGMIRDYWKIQKARLKDEIDALEDRVDPLTWKAIDAVRKMGNIGTHMEKDINVIVDVEPQEAADLIGLVELLIRDWYITRHEREERLKAIVAISEAKSQERANSDEPANEKQDNSGPEGSPGNFGSVE